MLKKRIYSDQPKFACQFVSYKQGKKLTNIFRMPGKHIYLSSWFFYHSFVSSIKHSHVYHFHFRSHNCNFYFNTNIYPKIWRKLFKHCYRIDSLKIMYTIKYLNILERHRDHENREIELNEYPIISNVFNNRNYFILFIAFHLTMK